METCLFLGSDLSWWIFEATMCFMKMPIKRAPIGPCGRHEFGNPQIHVLPCSNSFFWGFVSQSRHRRVICSFITRDLTIAYTSSLVLAHVGPTTSQWIRSPNEVATSLDPSCFLVTGVFLILACTQTGHERSAGRCVKLWTCPTLFET